MESVMGAGCRSFVIRFAAVATSSILVSAKYEIANVRLCYWFSTLFFSPQYLLLSLEMALCARCAHNFHGNLKYQLLLKPNAAQNATHKQWTFYVTFGNSMIGCNNRSIEHTMYWCKNHKCNLTNKCQIRSSHFMTITMLMMLMIRILCHPCHYHFFHVFFFFCRLTVT